MSLIPEIYNEKYISDIQRENKKIRKLSLDEFFYAHITKTYKLEEFIKINCENTIQGIIDNSRNNNYKYKNSRRRKNKHLPKIPRNR